MPQRRHFDTIKVAAMIIVEFEMIHVIINAIGERNDAIAEFHDCIYFWSGKSSYLGLFVSMVMDDLAIVMALKDTHHYELAQKFLSRSSY